MIQISLRSKRAQYSLVAVEILVAFALTALVARAYIAEVLANALTVGGLQAAIRLDPGNARYHLELGRLYLYTPANMDLNKASEELKRATELNPYDPQAWLDLAYSQESQGNTSEAEASLRRADYLAPRLPSYQWVIGNFFLLHGSTDAAFRHFKVVLAGTSVYNRHIFTTAWKASGDAGRILETLIPRQVSTELDYLDFLVSRQQFPEAEQVWSRTVQSSEKFSPRQAAPYLDALVAAHQPDKAYQVWSDLRRKGMIPPTYEATNRNLIENGDFEEEPLNMGFDWRIGGAEGVYAGFDESRYHSAGHALLIQFSGTQNLDFRNIFQYVRVRPSHGYRLRAFLRCEAVTTDSGPRLEVRDAYDPGALDKFSEGVTGDTGSWTELRLDFTTGSKTELVVVGIARLPSHKLDNKIAGKVWIDDVTLQDLSEASTRPD